MRLVKATDLDGDPVYFDRDRVVATYRTLTGTVIYLDCLSDILKIKVKEDPQTIADLICNGNQHKRRDHKRNQQHEKPIPPSTVTIKGQG